ncbi:MAG TPA: hypothetical protein VF411_06215 [Bacteroidia bacterium]
MKFREKIPVFIFGLSVGLLAGCLFFIFKLDTYIRNFNLSLLNQKQNISEQVISPKKENDDDKTKDKNLNKNKADVKKESSARTKNESLISFNDITDSGYVNSENYQVLKEELISVKNMYVKTLTPEEKTNTADSLAASLANVSTPAKEEFFMIEFWKTPLNSKGYKMTRSRLLIYGYPENTDLALIKRNDNYYLRNNKVVFRLNYSSEFKPLERSNENDVAALFH